MPRFSAEERLRQYTEPPYYYDALVDEHMEAIALLRERRKMDLALIALLDRMSCDDYAVSESEAYGAKSDDLTQRTVNWLDGSK